jgi:hypothetical protein
MAPAGALTIKAGTNDVEVRGGGAAGTVSVSRHLSWGLAAQQPTPGDAWTGSVLELGADCHGAVSWCSADYVVTMPDSSDVTVATGSGDITLSGSLGQVALTAGSGDIETQDLVADRVSAQADSGDIEVDQR